MASKKQKNKKNGKESDPFDELNIIDDNLTIETEKDFFDEFEHTDLDVVPEYDSESGTIIKESQNNSQIRADDGKVVTDKIQLMTTIDEVDFNNKTEKVEKDESKDKAISKIKLPKKSSMPKPKKHVKKLSADKKTDDDTKIIDNVKVDSEGVPLLNQFDTEKIKESKLFPKITLSKISLTKIIMIVLGLIISIIGIYQAMNDVLTISDHVMYGEHASLAFGLIFMGIMIIILAFYREIMKMAGLNNISPVLEDEVSSKADKNKKTDKK